MSDGKKSTLEVKETIGKMPPFGTGYPEWSCSIDVETGTAWTVGAKQTMQCQGEYIEKLGENISIEFAEKEHSYSLKVLETQVSDHTSSTFIVTGYKAGNFKDVPFIVRDGQSGFFVPKGNWEIKTVLKKEEKPSPFGPNNPIELTMPMWYWASYLIATLLVILVVFRFFRKTLQRKRLLEELREHSTALTPYNQFNKEMRHLNRLYHGKKVEKKKENEVAVQYLGELDKTFKLYLVRELLVPALDWRAGEVMSEIKRRHRKIYNASGTRINKVLRELRKADVAKDQVELFDCDQLAEMSRDIANEIFKKKRGLK